MKKLLFALTTVILTIGLAWFVHRPSQPGEVTWEDVLEQGRKGGYRIIITEELRKHYQEVPQTLLIVDTRQEWEYQTGHIKGALNFPIESTWWSEISNRGALNTLLGPDKNRMVIFY